MFDLMNDPGSVPDLHPVFPGIGFPCYPEQEKAVTEDEGSECIREQFC